MVEEQNELWDDRVLEIPLPRSNLLGDEVFTSDGLVDMVILREHLQCEGRLQQTTLEKIVKGATRCFKSEPNLLHLGGKLAICGDIHGQFFDLLHIFEVGGECPERNYLFLGDYVDRGCFSVEVLVYLCALKYNYPEKIHLLRGNHECRRMTKFFNFKSECLYKHNEQVYKTFIELFDCLPLAALLAQKYFCVHAGISPDLRYIRDIDKIDRFQEIPREGPFCDLMWSDPFQDSSDKVIKWFKFNQKRGISFVYGRSAVKVFLKSNRIVSIIRGHTVEQDGYFMHFQKSPSQIPKVITVFSAPDYCDIYKNQGAIIVLAEGVIDILTFKSSPHPYYLPNFKDVFSWSLPFVSAKVSSILKAILQKGVEVLDEDVKRSKEENTSENIQTPTIRMSRVRKNMAAMKEKVMFISKMRLLLKKIRTHEGEVNQAKELSTEHRLPYGFFRNGMLDATISDPDQFEKMPLDDEYTEEMVHARSSEQSEALFRDLEDLSLSMEQEDDSPEPSFS